MTRQPEPLGDVQLEVLQFVADHHPIRVGEVAEHFAETSGKARTTILTVMEKLREKGYLVRKKIKGTFHYSPRIKTSDVLARMIQLFIKGPLKGSVSPLIAYLADSDGVTDSELASLKNLVRDLEKRRKEGDQ